MKRLFEFNETDRGKKITFIIFTYDKKYSNISSHKDKKWLNMLGIELTRNMFYCIAIWYSRK